MWLLDKVFARVVRDGELTVAFAGGTTRSYGRPRPGHEPVAIRLTTRATATSIARSPSLGAAEAYMDRRLLIERGELLDLLDLFAFNLRFTADRPGSRSRGASARRWLREHTPARRARRNVAHHYDLSSELYDLFLDDDRQYSCAYFRERSASLERAQLDKKNHIAAKLLLEPRQRVLDIGCGWGGLAMHLHRVAGVEVLGITLSHEQLRVARDRAERAGVASKVRFELLDYRDVRDRFDRVVSVGMFEHVGRPQFQAFFDCLRDRLPAHGIALLHTIGRANGPGGNDAFMEKYIFPGGYTPALSEIVPAVERAQLWATDVECLRVHYALTLEHWYARAQAARAEIVALYDERFFRMWSFYLAASLLAFRHGAHLVYQLQLARAQDAVPLTRDYIAEAEARYRALVPEQLAA